MKNLVINENNFRGIVFKEMQKIGFEPYFLNYFQSLIDKINYNESSKEKNEILAHAIIFNSFELLKILCESNCDVNLINLSGNIPLYLTIRRERFNMTRFLINKGANIYSLYSSKSLFNTNIDFQINLLYIFCINGDNETVKLLLDKGYDISSAKGNDYLLCAILNCKTEVAFTLINRGCDGSFRNAKTSTDEYKKGLEKLNIMIMSNWDDSLSSKFKEINRNFNSSTVDIQKIKHYFKVMCLVLITFINDKTRSNLPDEKYKIFKNWITIFLTECHDSIVAKKIGIDNIYIAKNLLQKFNCYLDSGTNFKSNFKKISDRENDNTEDFSTRVTKVLSDVDFYFNR